MLIQSLTWILVVILIEIRLKYSGHALKPVLGMYCSELTLTRLQMMMLEMLDVNGAKSRLVLDLDALGFLIHNEYNLNGHHG